MESSGGEILILTAFGEAERAACFARGLVEARIAACATLLPGARSFYRYQGDDIHDDAELLAFIKTHRDKLTDIEAYFRSHHPYECPELLVLDIAGISESYRNWLRTELRLDIDPPHL